MYSLKTRHTDNDDPWCVNLERDSSTDKVNEINIKLSPITNFTTLSEHDLLKMLDALMGPKAKYNLI